MGDFTRALLGAAVCILVTPPTGVLGQARQMPPDLGGRWFPSDSVQPLQVVGVVFDANTGEGLGAVSVAIVGTGLGALTRSSGRFSIQLPAPGEYEIEAVRVGYWRTRSRVRVEEGRGVTMQIATEPQPLNDCGLMVCGYPGCGAGVRVEVRALDTGLAPEGEVTLTVRSRRGVASQIGIAPARDSVYFRNRNRPTTLEVQASRDSVVARMPVQLSAGGELGSAGPFSVEVSAPQYEAWKAGDVWLEERECLPDASRVLRVWLMRTGR